MDFWMIIYVLVVSASAQQDYSYGGKTKDIIGLLPQDKKLHWKTTKLDSIKCPEMGLISNKEEHVVEKWLIERPRTTGKLRNKGKLCHLAKWITKCEYTWYFSKTVSRTIQNLEAHEDDCKQAIREYNQGKLIPGSFPPESCYWASTNEESVIAHIITPHEVTYDPYEDRYLDPLFVHGFCRTSFCETVYESTVWLTDSPGRQSSCKLEGDEPVEVLESYRHNKAGESKFGFWMRGSHIHHMPLSRLCKKEYCGKLGYVNQQGVWFHVTSVQWSYNESISFRHVVENCTESPDLVVLSEEFNDDDLAATLEEMMWDINCLNAVENIQKHKRASLHDLYQISQRHPGPGTAYRLKDGHLESAQANFVALYAPDEHEQNRECLGTVLDHTGDQCHAWDDWTHIANSTYHAVNGITEVDGKIVFPEYRVLKRRWDLEYSLKHDLRQINHPVISDFVGKVHENIVHKEIKSHSVNAGDLIGNWVTVAESKIGEFFKGFSHSFVTISVFLMVVLTIWIIIRCCQMCKREKPTKIISAKDDIPMVTSSFG
ncbi:glycoprotein [Fukuoka virus]|uniref:Glycoprotein n=1 Tax=Fukuoka virus TaxID=318849 RepID=A0A0D3R178_9RHAB|nr:glycoprotein [Fukuoka virus]AJR28418.1 glycoprotein [Fukuoka virus]